jgi:hypothetical protein
VVAKPDRGNEITGDAEADFESGIGGFIILRDGRGLARLPTAPQDQVYGGPRPLFQGISFHDTPEALRYLKCAIWTLQATPARSTLTKLLL